jgi:two-component system chemotaxis response regulator CheB
MSGAVPRKTRVLVVEDSPVVRELLCHILSRDPRLEVAAAVASGEEALRVLHQLGPEVISLDIRLPGMNGFEATRRIMSERPTPIVVVSASVESEDLRITMNALQAGALAVVEKPVGETRPEYESLARHLCTQLVLMSQVHVIRQRPLPSSRPRPTRPNGPLRLVAIACSTGGPAAVVELLNGLGRHFPAPLVLVQHLTPAFLPGFAAWLATVTPFRVEVVSGAVTLTRGVLYLAAADRHLYASAGRAWVDGGEPVCFERPSATVLFRSVARHFGAQASGVVLTGMGEDGADGLLELRRAGGYTIAEDESTAVVFGMPGAAVERGAACEILPLPAIAPRLLELVGSV